ncbi:Gfo/Idh/MocA family protein [Martelella mangrovi]|uniref:Dehydrogenase n=1 Tax=Martelella mangrovi TaxID=1397477 RepID=A0ABV2IDD0_9HYPH
METIGIGLIGAGTMAEFFARTIGETDGVSIRAVCPAGDEDAAAFATRFDVPAVYDDYEALGADKSIDAVYVVSLNTQHAEHTIAMLRAGKHVLVEKPLAANARQATAMVEAARAADRLLLELYPAPFEPNIAALRAALPRIGQLRRAVLVKNQYSSAYDAFKAGKRPAAFDPAFGGGSILDLGFYPVSLAVHLFGAPQSVIARGLMLSSGVDGQGSIILGYDGFEVDCLHSKIAGSALVSELAGESEALTLDDIATPRRIDFLKRGASRRMEPVEDLTRERAGNHLAYGIDAFITLLRAGAHESEVHPLENTVITHKILDEARRQVGVRFPSDEAAG